MDTPFLDSIVAESRGVASPQQVQDLEANVDKWRTGLIELLDQANNTLTNLNAHFHEEVQSHLAADEYRRIRADLQTRRAKTIRFKRAMEKRLREVNEIVAQRREERNHREEQMNELLDVLLNLIELDGIHNDVPAHLHHLLDQHLARLVAA